MSPDEKKEVFERRVKPTVIRRRAAPPPPPEKAKEAAAAQAPVEKPLEAPKKQPAPPGRLAPQRITAETLEVPLPPPPAEKEEKPRKGPKRKRSKAELELEDIQRAGGLKQFALQDEGEAAPVVERVFEPTLQLGRRKKPLRRQFKQTQITEIKAHKKVIRIEKAITVSELSQEMGVKSAELIKKLMGLGVMTTANQSMDTDTAALLASDYGYEIQQTAFKEEEVLKVPEAAGEDLQSRAPVVTVMGHVDHGKTSILDKIRKTKVAEGEAGGITQHIGAYEVTLPPKAEASSRAERGIHAPRSITFIDTPGHEAFTRMRARGAKVTDIVVLVVAADDGIMPQTIEAIDHAKAAGVPMVVAINKIDKPGADAEKVKRGLSEQGLLPEDWGGEVICVPTSAKTGQGLDQLLEMILLVAHMRELKAPLSGAGRGVLIETRLEKGRGVVVTLLVQKGKVHVGDYVVAGLHYGRVRALLDSAGQAVAQAGPSRAVSLLGLPGVPEAGEELFVVEDERDAKRIAQERQAKQRKLDLSATAKLSLEALQEQITRGEVHELALLVKADMAGSREALVESLTKLGGEKVSIKLVHSGTGAITENDVMLAKASRGVILGFNVVPEGKTRALAENEGVDIRLHSIIYEAIEDVQKAMQGLLKPEIKEKYLGRAEVKQVFRVSKVGNIGGSLVTDGLIRRNAFVRVVRDGKIVYEGKINSLKRLKDDAREVAGGLECGIGIEKFNDLKAGDLLECYVKEEIPQTL